MESIISILKILIYSGIAFIVFFIIYQILKFILKNNALNDKKGVLKAFKKYRLERIKYDEFHELTDLDLIIKDLYDNKTPKLIGKYIVTTELSFEFKEEGNEESGLKLVKKYIITKK